MVNCLGFRLNYLVRSKFLLKYINSHIESFNVLSLYEAVFRGKLTFVWISFCCFRRGPTTSRAGSSGVVGALASPVAASSRSKAGQRCGAQLQQGGARGPHGEIGGAAGQSKMWFVVGWVRVASEADFSFG